MTSFVTIIYIYIFTILYYTIWNYRWWNHKIPRLMTAFVPRDPSGSARRILLSASSFKTIRCCASEAVHPRSVNPSRLEYVWCNCEMFKCRFWFIYSRVAEICGMGRNTTSNGYSPKAWKVHPILPSHVLRDRIPSCTEFCVHHQQNN